MAARVFVGVGGALHLREAREGAVEGEAHVLDGRELRQRHAEAARGAPWWAR